MYFKGMLQHVHTMAPVSTFVRISVLILNVGTIFSVSEHQLTLFVIFDGFRWDYIDLFHVPTFHRFANSGVRARMVHNVMPTLTMSSHYTMFTGMYAESHGIVLNDFRDPTMGEYNMYSQEQQLQSHWFDTGAEPIWVTNQKAASDRFSGAMMVPTALASVMGISPTYQKGPLYDINVANESRVDLLIDWFQDNEKPINLGLLYFDEPDLTGHAFGTDTIQLKDNVEALDKVFMYLLERLEDVKLIDRMNIIVTADHGMITVPKKQFINITEFISRDLYKVNGFGAMRHVTPIPGKEEEVFEGLKQAKEKYPNFKVLRKSDFILKTHNYTRSNRISPIVLLADEGWYIITKDEEIQQQYNGDHGYSPNLPSMNPFFLASGPDIKKGYITESVNAVDFYELMCHLLEITPAPNNGSFANIKHILLESELGIRDIVINNVLGLLTISVVYFSVKWMLR